MEVDRGFEVRPIAEAASHILDPLDFGVDAFTGGVGDFMLQVG